MKDNVVMITNPTVNEKAIMKTLKLCGVRPGLLGYTYLGCAIRNVLLNKDLLNNMTKRLYPLVADTFNTTSTRVERAMRHAIEVAFDCIEPKVLSDVFGNTVSALSGKVTNTQFIATLAEYISLEVIV